VALDAETTAIEIAEGEAPAVGLEKTDTVLLVTVAMRW